MAVLGVDRDDRDVDGPGADPDEARRRLTPVPRWGRASRGAGAGRLTTTGRIVPEGTPSGAESSITAAAAASAGNPTTVSQPIARPIPPGPGLAIALPGGSTPDDDGHERGREGGGDCPAPIPEPAVVLN